MFRLLLPILFVCTIQACKSQNGNKGASDPDVLLTRGKNALSANLLETAERRVEKANKIRPNHYETVAALTKIYLRRGKLADAKDLTGDYTMAVIDDPRGYKLAADVMIRQRNYRGAISALSSMRDLMGENAEVYDARGRAHMLAGNISAAVIDLERAVKLAGDVASYRASYGAALYRSGDRRQATRQLEKALELDPRSARAHRVLGTIMRKRDQITEAIDHLEQAAKLQPNSARNHFELGITYNYRARNEESERSLARAVKLEDTNPTYWYAYGEILRTLKRYKEAIPAYRRALELDPNHIKAPGKLGVVLFYAGKMEEAELTLTETIRRTPKNPYLYFNLGFVYEGVGKQTLAIAAFRRFLELAPADDGDRAVAQKKIRELK